MKQGGRLPEEEVREARGFSGILAFKVRWYNRALTRSGRVEGQCRSSLKRVLDRQGSKVQFTRNNRLHTPCHSALRGVLKEESSFTIH